MDKGFDFMGAIDLFGPAFITGLAFAIYLPLLGCYLRLRDETLAALAFAQISAAGALGAMALHIPLTAGGLGAATALAGIKQSMPQRLRTRTQRSTFYALLLILGWAVSTLLSSNLPLADRLGHALFDGQLLLNGGQDLVLTLITCTLGMGLLFMLSRQLLLAQIFPDIWRLNSQRWRHLHLLFDVLTALTVALATMRLGVMTVFALVVITPWISFYAAASWRSARGFATTLAIAAYCIGFGLSLWGDQPFGPMVVLGLMGMGALKAAGSFMGKSLR